MRHFYPNKIDATDAVGDLILKEKRKKECKQFSKIATRAGIIILVGILIFILWL